MEMEKALIFKNVSKKFTDFEVQIDSFELVRGSIMGLVGPNGAGKSTMIKMIMNLVHPDSGNISVLGRDYLKQEQQVKNLVGYVPEDCRIYEEVTANWVGQFVSHYYKTWDHDYFRALLQKFGLSGNKKVKQLSKGNKMKLSLSLALAHKPELLLLDEPTSGLDPVVRYDLLQELLEVIQDESRTVLLSSHIIGDIEKVADYVGFLRQGKLVLYNDKESILEKYKRVQLKLASTVLIETIRDYFIQYSNEGAYFQGVTGEYSEELLQELQRRGVEDIKVLPLTLEEIMIVLSREGV
ncbi:MAG: ABC transporter ATP-binding protein [Firmicutes bacterium]|nr:ABC transporter ATP-binding protein [Bacillota bacterium]